MELIWAPAKEPRPLAAMLLAYMIATLVGCSYDPGDEQDQHVG